MPAAADERQRRESQRGEPGAAGRRSDGEASRARRAAIASVATMTAWPSSMLMAVESASTSHVQPAACQTVPAGFTVRHHSTRYASDATVTIAPAARARRGTIRCIAASPLGRVASEPEEQRGEQRERRDAQAEERAEVEGQHDAVAHAGDETGQAHAERDRGGRTEQQRGEQADAHARSPRGAEQTLAAAHGTEDEAVHAGVEVAEFAQPRAQVVDRWSLFVMSVCRLSVLSPVSCPTPSGRPRSRPARAAGRRAARTARAPRWPSGTTRAPADAPLPRR